jgi:hypothetical protein
MGKHRVWTRLDEKFIKENYSRMSAREMAFQLNTTSDAVYARVRKLGLNKGPKTTASKITPPQTKQIVVDNKNLQSIEFDIQGVKIHMVFK